MIRSFVAAEKGLKEIDLQQGTGVPEGLAWVDLLGPTVAEEHLVATILGIDLPTHEEMQEIEVSSRLYQQEGKLFMTAWVLTRSETDNPQSTAVTFILADDHLVTVRYADPRSFAAFITRVGQAGAAVRHGETVLVGLLDAIVDRTADVLERTGAEVEAVSHTVFEHSDPRSTKSRDFQEVLRRIGRIGGLASKARESLVSIGRLTAFLSQSMDGSRSPKELRARLKTVSRDVHALTDHASFLNNKINFLLDATLGMINIEQNAIIKIFSVAAVVFLPPTLIASIYGMNFAHLPELEWLVGYPFSLLLMVASALLPYLYFKRRGWL